MISSDILGVVLAGGASRRMGRDKAALPWTGTTLARRAAAVLAESFAEVVIAGPGDLAPGGVEAVADRFPGRGPLAGLHAGLERAAGRAIFALACDLPFVGSELVRHLVSVSAAGAGSGPGDAGPAGAWVAAGPGGPQPLCGLWAPGCRTVAAQRLRSGELAVRGFLEAVGGVEVPIGPELPFFRPELLLNVNRPAELRQARQLRAALGEAAR